MFSRKQFFLTITLLASTASAAEIAVTVHKIFLDDDPLWAEPKPRPARNVASIEINNLFDFIDESFVVPHAERKGQRHGNERAMNVNTLGDVPDSEWFTNRKGKRAMTIKELQRGPGNTHPPDPTTRWRVISAKTDGVTPGLQIEDGRGNRYMLKFDPPGFPELASAADVIGSKIYYALGYNTPENYIVNFRRDQLTLTDDSTWKDATGKKHALTPERIDKLITGQPKDSEGRYRAMASRFVEGKPIGPFMFQGTRPDDPNDIVGHELRRELRGMAVFAAWINDTDAKSINTLDALAGPAGMQYVRHYRIDWGASLGSDSVSPKDIRRGHDYFIDPKATTLQAVSFGFYLPEWMRTSYPKLRGVGNFDYRSFDAAKWRSNYPTLPFLLMDDEDAFWAARKVMSFSDEEIRALVETGQYTDPRATEWIAKCLIGRRDKIAQAWLSRGLALDDFRVENGRLGFVDLAQVHRVGPARDYAIEWSVFDNAGGARQPVETDGPSWTVPESTTGFIAASIRTKSDPSEVNVYLRRIRDGWTVVGIDRRHK